MLCEQINLFFSELIFTTLKVNKRKLEAKDLEEKHCHAVQNNYVPTFWAGTCYIHSSLSHLVGDSHAWTYLNPSYLQEPYKKTTFSLSRRTFFSMLDLWAPRPNVSINLFDPGVTPTKLRDSLALLQNYYIIMFTNLIFSCRK